MKKIFIGLVILIGILFVGIIVYISIFISGFSPGTHGSVKSYSFNVSKFELENTIDNIFKTNNGIARDTSTTDYYNKDGYVEMTIRKNDKEIKYNFRYYGDSTMWKNNQNNSEIFICYLYDSKGKAISEGNDNVNENEDLVNEQITIFEDEFIRRINQQLNNENIK